MFCTRPQNFLVYTHLRGCGTKQGDSLGSQQDGEFASSTQLVPLRSHSVQGLRIHREKGRLKLEFKACLHFLMEFQSRWRLNRSDKTGVRPDILGEDFLLILAGRVHTCPHEFFNPVIIKSFPPE